MKRHLLTGATVASLLAACLSLGAGVGWLRLRPLAFTAWDHRFVVFGYCSRLAVETQPVGACDSESHKRYPGESVGLAFRHTASPTPLTVAWVHFYHVAACGMILPCAWVARRYGRWLLALDPPPGCCPACEYDLRASAGRCPECGRAVESAVACKTSATSA